MSNLSPEKTRIPVRVFLVENIDLAAQIAGLLDYGYVPMQISKMLNLNRLQVEDIMDKNGWRTI